MNAPHRGTLFVVGLGPGSPGLITPDAASAIEQAEVVVGYRGYLDLIADRLAGKELVGRDLGQEIERAEVALNLAEAGRNVALVSSGDAGVYGMGGVAMELAASRQSPAQIVVVPGVTAAISSSALLGAPLAHDWACISLSDLLTPWHVIVRRVEAASRADFVLALYNPKSRTRDWQLPFLAKLLLKHRSPETCVGLVENASRAAERVEITRLDRLEHAHVSMFTTVIIGSSRTFVDRGRMVTPRIYQAKTSVGGQATGDGLGRAGVGDAIMAESLAMIDREMGSTPSEKKVREVVRRMIHASADFDYVKTFRCDLSAIDRAVAAFQSGRPVVVDVEMLRAGVRRDLAGPLGVEATCSLGDFRTEALAASEGLTRSAAGIRLAASHVGDGAVVAVGNAPTALMEAIRLVEVESWRPACIVGIPVGFVGVEESKTRLIEQAHVPFITSLGRKGGTAVTAAAINALLSLAGGGASS